LFGTIDTLGKMRDPGLIDTPGVGQVFDTADGIGESADIRIE
jgi:hypothetical protein